MGRPYFIAGMGPLSGTAIVVPLFSRTRLEEAPRVLSLRALLIEVRCHGKAMGNN